MPIQKMSESEVENRLRALPGWTLASGKLHREYKFTDFIHAFGFMATAAIAIEKRNHHPEWFNLYNRVVVDLTTHDAGGISQRDFDLARTLDELAGKLS